MNEKWVWNRQLSTPKMDLLSQQVQCFAIVDVLGLLRTLFCMRVHYASSVAVKLSAEEISASFKTNLFLQVAEQFTQKK